MNSQLFELPPRYRMVVVAYDVCDDARRDRLARLLEAYGVRVQYSVFECVVRSTAHADLVDRVRRLIDEKEDTIAFYTLCRGCRGDLLRLGVTPAGPDPKCILV